MEKLNYFYSLTDNNGYVYSVDNIRISFQLNPKYYDEFSQSFVSLSRTDIQVSPLCNSSFKFRYFLEISYSDTAKMIVGFGFNGADSQNDKYKGFIEVNPNKCGHFRRFLDDFRLIKSCCEDFICKRIDLAIDLPVKREMLILEKDSRKYELNAYSLENKTEYLGIRSNTGYVKVYNKTIESKLDYDLSRIEMTIEPSYESFVKCCPRVWDISRNGQLDLEWLNLNDTDLTILRMELQLLSNGLDAGLMIFNGLARTKKQKLKQFLLPESCLVCFDSTVFVNLVRWFNQFFMSN